MVRTSIIRTIHHLASSGGTIISKAIAAQPNVVFLSELNPNHAALFAPLDPFPQLFTNYPHLFPGRTRADLFVDRIHDVHDACVRAGSSLVIRDHSHTDFMLRKIGAPELRKALQRSGFELRSIATIRHPIDAWLSMSESGFNRTIPDFTTYCQRVKSFAEFYADLPLFRYEDFIADTPRVVAAMAGKLDLAFDEGFEGRMGNTRITGDSGRLKNNARVQPLQRRHMPDQLREEASRPENIDALAALGYEDPI